MKSFTLAAACLAISASSSLAESRHAGPTQNAPSPKATVVVGRHGEDVTQRCSAQNPNIEYRDCVNASTRDPNAKIRLG